MSSVIIDIQGTEIAANEIENIQHPQTAGVILFARNIDSFAQTRELCDALREVNPNILISVDQEGGRVQRLKDEIGELPPMRALGNLYDKNAVQAIDATRKIGWLMASEVAAAGIDFSFAPVLDIDYQHSSIIGNRAFHGDKTVLIELAQAFVSGMNSAGMQATGKHFPGHGYVVPDSHLELPIDNRDYADIEASDIQPFAHLVSTLGGVMPAHIVFEKIDAMPACFSEHWLQTVLRNTLGFEGVIFSDDLSMKGSAVIGNYAQRTTKALQAGCDVVLVCNTPSAQRSALDAAEALNKKQSSRWNTFKQTSYPLLGNLRNTNQYQEAKQLATMLQSFK